MRSFAQEHAMLFIVTMIFALALTTVHLVGAVEYGKTKKRSVFETLALAAFLSVGWWLFALGMMWRGYVDFWDKTWGNHEAQ